MDILGTVNNSYESRIDILGNLILHKPYDGKKVLLADHTDEVSFIVKSNVQMEE
jgi:putative aminopeptidase FrvX